jgi:hypothetical protein
MAHVDKRADALFQASRKQIMTRFICLCGRALLPKPGTFLTRFVATTRQNFNEEGGCSHEQSSGMELTSLRAFQRSRDSVASLHVEGVRLHDQEQPAKYPLMPVIALSLYTFLYFYFSASCA